MELTLDNLQPTRTGRFKNSATAYSLTIKESTGHYVPKETAGITPKGSVYYKMVTPAKDFSQIYIITKKGVLKVISNIKTSYGSKAVIETSKNGEVITSRQIEKHKKTEPHINIIDTDRAGKKPKMELPRNVEETLELLKAKSKTLKKAKIKKHLFRSLKKLLMIA